MKTVPDGTFTGKQGKNHIQGMAVDTENGYIYYSFTTKLVKTDLAGHPVGSVTGLVGHLGCIARDPETGRIFGSLEYKRDGIGKGILASLGDSRTLSDGFYAVMFDPEKITRENMSAETDGVMRAAFLEEALRDYEGTGVNADGAQVPHAYGCSGIDGVTFAPLPGDRAGKLYLYVAYGVYGDTGRNDNDHQVLLCYDPQEIFALARPLSQNAMHRSGPAPAHKYFVFTGNTEYGVQNLEYDAYAGAMLMAVYAGKKPSFVNYDHFAVDMEKPAVSCELRGLSETGEALTLLGSPAPESDAICGWYLPYGQFGLVSLADGTFYVAEPVTAGGEQAARVYRYRWSAAEGWRLCRQTATER
ncbi:MAG: hypothetical protein IJK02_11865 [Clostridia bacterium]|nr:hypothetical protein [Clostridia bacterium]